MSILIRYMPHLLNASTPKSAFEGSGVETVSLPEGLTAISDACFYGCDKLKHVELPETLETIGSIAFHYCTALEELTLPDSVRRIRSDAFSKCSSLRYISLPEGLQELDKTALQDCDQLEQVEFRGSQAQWQALTEAWDEESVEDKVRLLIPHPFIRSIV